MFINIQKVDIIVFPQINLFLFCSQFIKYLCKDLSKILNIGIWMPIDHTYYDVFIFGFILITSINRLSMFW